MSGPKREGTEEGNTGHDLHLPVIGNYRCSAVPNFYMGAGDLNPCKYFTY